MIYVSTYYLKRKRIIDQVLALSHAGFKNIELTGGTDFYEDLVDDLSELKKEKNLNYKLHNYFPPPKEHFVFNLASIDKKVSESSFEHAKRAIDLSRFFGAQEIGFHAGFFIHISTNELGKNITNRELYDEDESIDKFVDQLTQLNLFAGEDFKIYIENNVVSKRNKDEFPDRNPSMLTNFSDFSKLKKKIDFHLLLDIAHLKVSCKSLNLDFQKEFDNLFEHTDYIHVSDNNSLEDQNLPLIEGSELSKILIAKDLSGCDFTLEVFGKINDLKASFNHLQEITAKN